MICHMLLQDYKMLEVTNKNNQLKADKPAC